MAKNVRLHENAKVAQKLRSATSQFSGGTKYRIRTLNEFNSTPRRCSDVNKFNQFSDNFVKVLQFSLETWFSSSKFNL